MAKAALEVYAFNVRFGDAILVRVPDKDRQGPKTTLRHILIDVGNAPSVAREVLGDHAVHGYRPVYRASGRLR